MNSILMLIKIRIIGIIINKTSISGVTKVLRKISENRINSRSMEITKSP